MQDDIVNIETAIIGLLLASGFLLFGVRYFDCGLSGKYREEGIMFIRVRYTDGEFDMVNPQELDNLLKEKRIACFLRSSGWAVVGRDPIRHRPQGYAIPERRQSLYYGYALNENDGS